MVSTRGSQSQESGDDDTAAPVVKRNDSQSSNDERPVRSSRRLKEKAEKHPEHLDPGASGDYEDIVRRRGATNIPTAPKGYAPPADAGSTKIPSRGRPTKKVEVDKDDVITIGDSDDDVIPRKESTSTVENEPEPPKSARKKTSRTPSRSASVVPDEEVKTEKRATRTPSRRAAATVKEETPSRIKSPARTKSPARAKSPARTTRATRSMTPARAATLDTSSATGTPTRVTRAMRKKGYSTPGQEEESGSATKFEPLPDEGTSETKKTTRRKQKGSEELEKEEKEPETDEKEMELAEKSNVSASKDDDDDVFEETEKQHEDVEITVKVSSNVVTETELPEIVTESKEDDDEIEVIEQTQKEPEPIKEKETVLPEEPKESGNEESDEKAHEQENMDTPGQLPPSGGISTRLRQRNERLCDSLIRSMYTPDKKTPRRRSTSTASGLSSVIASVSTPIAGQGNSSFMDWEQSATPKEAPKENDSESVEDFLQSEKTSLVVNVSSGNLSSLATNDLEEDQKALDSASASVDDDDEVLELDKTQETAFSDVDITPGDSLSNIDGEALLIAAEKEFQKELENAEGQEEEAPPSEDLPGLQVSAEEKKPTDFSALQKECATQIVEEEKAEAVANSDEEITLDAPEMSPLKKVPSKASSNSSVEILEDETQPEVTEKSSGISMTVKVEENLEEPVGETTSAKPEKPFALESTTVELVDDDSVQILDENIVQKSVETEPVVPKVEVTTEDSSKEVQSIETEVEQAEASPAVIEPSDDSTKQNEFEPSKKAEEVISTTKSCDNNEEDAVSVKESIEEAILTVERVEDIVETVAEAMETVVPTVASEEAGESITVEAASKDSIPENEPLVSVETEKVPVEDTVVEPVQEVPKEKKTPKKKRQSILPTSEVLEIKEDTSVDSSTVIQTASEEVIAEDVASVDAAKESKTKKKKRQSVLPPVTETEDVTPVEESAAVVEEKAETVESEAKEEITLPEPEVEASETTVTYEESSKDKKKKKKRQSVLPTSEDVEIEIAPVVVTEVAPVDETPEEVITSKINTDDKKKKKRQSVAAPIELDAIVVEEEAEAAKEPEPAVAELPVEEEAKAEEVSKKDKKKKRKSQVVPAPTEFEEVPPVEEEKVEALEETVSEPAAEVTAEEVDTDFVTKEDKKKKKKKRQSVVAPVELEETVAVFEEEAEPVKEPELAVAELPVEEEAKTEEASKKEKKKKRKSQGVLLSTEVEEVPPMEEEKGEALEQQVSELVVEVPAEEVDTDVVTKEDKKKKKKKRQSVLPSVEPEAEVVEVPVVEQEVEKEVVVEETEELQESQVVKTEKTKKKKKRQSVAPTVEAENVVVEDKPSDVVVEEVPIVEEQPTEASKDKKKKKKKRQAEAVESDVIVEQPVKEVETVEEPQKKKKRQETEAVPEKPDSSVTPAVDSSKEEKKKKKRKKSADQEAVTAKKAKSTLFDDEDVDELVDEVVKEFKEMKSKDVKEKVATPEPVKDEEPAKKSKKKKNKAKKSKMVVADNDDIEIIEEVDEAASGAVGYPSLTVEELFNKPKQCSNEIAAALSRLYTWHCELQRRSDDLPDTFLNNADETVWQFVAHKGRQINKDFRKYKDLLDEPLSIPGFEDEQEEEEDDDEIEDMENENEYDNMEEDDEEFVGDEDEEEIDLFNLKDEDLKDLERELADMDNEEDDEAGTSDKENTNEKPKKKYPKSSVDDKFFNLAEMDAFCDEAEKTNDDEGILSTVDDSWGGPADYRYEEFFGTLDGAVGGKADKKNKKRKADDSEGNKSKKQKKSVRFAMDEEEDEEEEAVEEPENEEEVMDEDQPVLLGKNADEQTPESNLKVTIRQLKETIRKLEQENLEPRSWELAGEVTATQRGENELLDKHLQFDNATKRAPEVTEDFTEKLEALIKQRIKDQAFDDVVRIKKVDEKADVYRNEAIEEMENMKKSLSEVYEKEYQKAAGQNEAAPAENEQHKAIQEKVNNLFQLIDAMSHFEYTPPQVRPEIRVVSNMAALRVEEVGMQASTDAQLLAPEEMKKKQKGDLKADEERTSTDKLRQRRKKKTKQRAMVLTMGAEKALSGQIEKKIKKKSKKVAGGDKPEESMKSSNFFSKLQDTVQKELKQKTTKKKKVVKSEKVTNGGAKFKL